ncbi:MAG: DNA repair protein RadC [Deltaproteobacteria bacterium]|nr:DNA repair protein RadC [Deltaproteobacteria bacterium]
MERLYLPDFPGTRYRVSLVREDDVSNSSESVKPILNPEDAYQYVRGGLESKDREFFVSILLDAKNVPLGVSLISIGDLTCSVVHPREVFKAAILASASGIIVAHNHPSGSPAPSKDDLRVTFMLKQAGEIINIPLLDHIIVGRDTYYSMKQSGRL